MLAWRARGSGDCYEWQVAAIDDYGLDDIAMDQVVTSIDAFVGGLARGWVAEQERLSLAETDLEWWLQTGAVLDEVMAGHDYPVSGRVGQAAGEDYGLGDAERSYRFGLDLLINGVEALLLGGSAEAGASSSCVTVEPGMGIGAHDGRMSTAVPTHLVGSINQPDAESVFRLVADRLDTVPRIPDGEVGERYYWIQFQTLRFDQTPGLQRVGEPGYRIRDTFDVRPFRVTGEVVLGELGYAAAAIESYERFAALQDRGVVAKAARFQVSLPTPIAIVGAFIEPGSRAAFEPVYRDALHAEVDRILAAIPHERLAIQFDAAVEFAILERDRRPAFVIVPWWEGTALDGVLERLIEVGSWVPAGAELGYHLCYGDVEEAHFVQPEDAGNLAAVSRGVLAGSRRSVDFIHLPVPIERDDAAFFAPLAGLEWGQTQVFLGLVHHEDGVAGALRRAEAARTAVPAFGVATECGFGRGPAERTAPLLDIHRDVAAALAA